MKLQEKVIYEGPWLLAIPLNFLLYATPFLVFWRKMVTPELITLCTFTLIISTAQLRFTRNNRKRLKAEESQIAFQT